ncbi:Transketolase [Aquisphaera giovannonii]|uniref:Transketolase n=1 Tax=Aquisphaera giovannonii TaxID=406548 RepID=A0A5B9VVD0_9BACT|nr:transketolase [Aquisphaera giovannonii]QEH31745.1 Transketolase [Aquisphaera giovannonii]
MNQAGPRDGGETAGGKSLDELCIDTLRVLAIDAVQEANSGHPGLPMGAATMAYVLWTRFLKYNPRDPLWPDRDRFVLSAGHGSMLLYALLHLTGYDLPLGEIERFRRWGSRTPGHPERGHHTPGVELSTGPLGQGFANGVGLAIAESWLAARFNRPGHAIVDHHTYALVSDGDLMEGITHEAASLAGHLRLGKLIYLYDQNRVTLAGVTDLSFTEDVAGRFDAYGWHTRHVPDGDDVGEITRAIEEARAERDRPSLLLVRTRIGRGSPKKEGTFGAHGSPLGEDEVRATKRALGWPTTDRFYLPGEAVRHFREAVGRGAGARGRWDRLAEAYAAAHPEEWAEWRRIMGGELPEGWAGGLPSWKPEDKPVATRTAAGQALNALAARIPNILGGSADLNPSTSTALKDRGDYQPPGEAVGPGTPGAVGGAWGRSGRNLHFGVREHAMGAAVNGMAAHGGVIPYGATFLVFSDYMKPSIRLGALMGLHAVYVFTHDSIAVGEDGPTHEPVEQLVGLRAIPGLTVIRPADANEAAEAWAVAVERDGPIALALSRQNLPILDRADSREPGVRRGAYILAEAAGGRPEVILIGSGSEVFLCMKARERLAALGVAARVISMPSWELFDAQDAAYRDRVLPPAVRKRVAIEAGSPIGWERYAGSEGAVIGIDRFGASAPGEEVMERFGFTVGRVTAEALRLLGRRDEAAKEEAGGEETAVAPTGPREGHS